IKALRDGTVDVLCSGHMPHDEESKSLEFDRAEFGITGLQTFCAHLTALSEQVDWEVLVAKVTSGPRRVLKLDAPSVTEGSPANLTLIDPHRKWTFNDETNYSRSKNSPWYGKVLTGKAVAVFNNGKTWLDL